MALNINEVKSEIDRMKKLLKEVKKKRRQKSGDCRKCEIREVFKGRSNNIEKTNEIEL